jgi:hypothetical protein
MKRKAYESDPLPISMTWEQYKDGTRDAVNFDDGQNQFVDMATAVNIIKDKQSDHSRYMNLFSPTDENTRRYGPPIGRAIPASFSLPVDKAKVLANGTVADKDSSLVVDKIRWNLTRSKYVYKAYIIMMDILANNNWERPIYYASTTGPEAWFGLEEYFQQEGMAYRLVPIRTPRSQGYSLGRIDVDILYDNLMNVFDDHSRPDRIKNPEAAKQHKPYPYLWGGFNDPRVYNPEDNIKMAPTFRELHNRLAKELIAQNRLQEAEKVLDHENLLLPDEVIPLKMAVRYYNATLFATDFAHTYLQIKTPSAQEKGIKVLNRLLDYFIQEFKWYDKVNDKTLAMYQGTVNYNYVLLNMMLQPLDSTQRAAIQDKLSQIPIQKSSMVQLSMLGRQMDADIANLNEKMQDVYDKFRDIKMIALLAQAVRNSELEAAAMQMIESRLEKIATLSPELANQYRSMLDTRNVQYL